MDSNFNNLPIVFCHFGDSAYCKFSFKSAVDNNPDSQVYLLGDQSNQHYTKFGVIHENLSEHETSFTIKIKENFVYIRGGKRYHTTPSYLVQRCNIELFCFLRWAYLLSFMEKKNIDACWFFDSDTIITVNLSKFNYDFQGFDCTELSLGRCAKGFITRNFLRRFCKNIIQYFRDENFLKEVLVLSAADEAFAYCDMLAYEKMAKVSNINSLYIGKPRNGFVFDDALRLVEGFESIFSFFIFSKVKKIIYEEGRIFTRNTITNDLCELCCINTSWLPFFYIEYIYNRTTGSSYLNLNFLFRYLLWIFDCVGRLSFRLLGIRRARATLRRLFS